MRQRRSCSVLRSVRHRRGWRRRRIKGNCATSRATTTNAAPSARRCSSATTSTSGYPPNRSRSRRPRHRPSTSTRSTRCALIVSQYYRLKAEAQELAETNEFKSLQQTVRERIGRQRRTARRGGRRQRHSSLEMGHDAAERILRRGRGVAETFREQGRLAPSPQKLPSVRPFHRGLRCVRRDRAGRQRSRRPAHTNRLRDRALSCCGRRPPDGYAALSRESVYAASSTEPLGRIYGNLRFAPQETEAPRTWVTNGKCPPLFGLE